MVGSDHNNNNNVKFLTLTVTCLDSEMFYSWQDYLMMT